MTPYLTAKEITLHTPTGELLCDRLNITLEAQACWGILGENGVGKSTLLRCLAGLNEPTQGHIQWFGKTLTMRNLARCRAYLSQDFTYPSQQTVEEAILTARYPYKPIWQWYETEEDKKIVNETLSKIELLSLKNRLMGTLSGGEARRVAIAASLAQRTPLLLMDEPTTYLDLAHQHRTLHIVSAFCEQNNAAIITFQDPNLVMRYCTHTLLLFKDHTWLAGKTETILTPQNLTELYQYDIQMIDKDHQRYFVAL